MKYSDKFYKALSFTLRWEGGYSNHPYDKGGCTNKGITQKTYDDYCKSNKKPNIPVKLIKDFEVEEIYHNNYWDVMNCESLEKCLSIAVFDFAVNSGTRRCKEYLMSRNHDSNSLNRARIAFLKRIGKGNNKVFLKGWLNRMAALEEYLKEV